MRNKLPAFTMIELIAVMLLSGLIFSLALLVIQITQQQDQKQTQDHAEVLGLEQLSLLLKKDAYQSKAMFIEGKQLFFDYDLYGIRYQFNDNNVCRSILETEVHTDTFAFKTIELECEWKGLLIDAGRIDKLHWQSQFFEQLIDINIQKQYDSKTLLELEQYVHTTSF